MKIPESQKICEIQLIAAQLLLAKMTHNFAESMEIVGQQQKKIVHFSICLLLCYIPQNHSGIKLEFVIISHGTEVSLGADRWFLLGVSQGITVN